MPGVAQVWLTQEELSALILAATKKGTQLSPRMAESIVPKLDTARSYLGCPVPSRQREEKDWPPAEPTYGGF